MGADADFGGLAVPVWVLLLTCAIVSTAVAYLLSISSMRYLPSNVLSVIALCEPIVATSLAWLVLGQALTVLQVLGAAVLLAGATVVQLASRQGPENSAEIRPTQDPVHPQG
jgi:drug/metabolite transporter (DMT)-like permease